MVFWQAGSCMCGGNDRHHPSTHGYLSLDSVRSKQDVCFGKTWLCQELLAEHLS